MQDWGEATLQPFSGFLEGGWKDLVLLLCSHSNQGLGRTFKPPQPRIMEKSSPLCSEEGALEEAGRGITRWGSVWRRSG